MQPKEKKKDTSKWYLGGAAAFLLLKGKALLALLKFGKIGGALISMAASIWAYTIIYPWQFATGFVLLLLVHEMGHVIAAKQKGLPVSAPLFIPFLGALISMKRNPLNAQTEAYLAMGGPVLGTVGAVAVFAAAYLTDSPLLYSLAYVGFFLNLINLLPIHPLDGGRIATAVTRWLWLVGLVGGIVVIVYLKSFLFFIIWAMFAYDLYKKFIRHRKLAHAQESANSVMKQFLIPVEHLYAAGHMLPGIEHRRDLPFNTYSDLEGQQYVTIRWDSLDFEDTTTLPQQSLVKRARVTRLEQVQKETGLHIKMYCEIEYTVFENDKYYEVPVSSRWKFGIGYLVLAIFLIGMMYLVHQIGNIHI